MISIGLMNRVRPQIAGSAVLAVLAFGSAALAVENEPTKPAAPRKVRVTAPAAAPLKSARLQKLQGLVDSREWLKDPFRHLQTDMVYVIDDLAELETRVPAEITQPKILSRLDVLVEMLEKQCKKAGGAGGSPLQRSMLAGGPGGQGDMNAPRNSRRKWAELTPKERERILQSKTEGFPAGYEDILAEYFRRLATEESVRAIAPGPAHPTGSTKPDKSR